MSSRLRSGKVESYESDREEVAEKPPLDFTVDQWCEHWDVPRMIQKTEKTNDGFGQFDRAFANPDSEWSIESQFPGS
jgi:hypothetical protein